MVACCSCCPEGLSGRCTPLPSGACCRHASLGCFDVMYVVDVALRTQLHTVSKKVKYNAAAAEAADSMCLVPFHSQQFRQTTHCWPTLSGCDMADADISSSGERQTSWSAICICEGTTVSPRICIALSAETFDG